VFKKLFSLYANEKDGIENFGLREMIKMVKEFDIFK